MVSFLLHDFERVSTRTRLNEVMGWISDVGTKAFTAGVAQISSIGFVHHVGLDADWTLRKDVLHQPWE